VGDNAGAFFGPLLAVVLLYAIHVDIRAIFYLAIIPGLLAFGMVLFVSEKSTAVPLKSKIDLHVRRFPPGYWKYLSVTALFNVGNSSNAFLILRTQDTGVSLRSSGIG
jgi:MFS family permease